MEYGSHRVVHFLQTRKFKAPHELRERPHCRDRSAGHRPRWAWSAVHRSHLLRRSQSAPSAPEAPVGTVRAPRWHERRCRSAHGLTLHVPLHWQSAGDTDRWILSSDSSPSGLGWVVAQAARTVSLGRRRPSSRAARRGAESGAAHREGGHRSVAEGAARPPGFR